jgi:putative transposase
MQNVSWRVGLCVAAKLSWSAIALSAMGTVTQAYRFALDPTPGQVEALSSHAGGQRFAYNWGLDLVRVNLSQRAAERSHAMPEAELTPAVGWSGYELRKHWNAVKHMVAPWWQANSKEVYSAGLAHLATALGNWKASRSGARRGPRVGFPRRKFKRRTTPSFTVTTTGAFGLAGGDRRHVKLPRIGAVRTHESTRKLARHLERGTGRILSATVSYRRGRWQVAFTVTVDKHEPAPPASTDAVGVDLGVKSLAVLSTGEHVANPKHLARAQAELRRRQRQAARRYVGGRKVEEQSRRWHAAQARVARLHAKVANARADGLHQLSTRLTRQHAAVVVEDLNVTGMTRSAKGTVAAPGRNVAAKAGLNRRVLDAGFGELRRQLDYKTRWAGRTLHVADRWYPSSKTCSDCGVVKTKLRLSQRTFTCDSCGLSMDRDDNAARSLAALVGETTDGGSSPSCGARVNEADGTPYKASRAGSGDRHGKTAAECAANAA